MPWINLHAATETDSEERHNISKQNCPEEIQFPFLLRVNLNNLSCLTNPSKAFRYHPDEENKSDESPVFAYSHELICLVPHVPAPDLGSLDSYQPPLTKTHNQVIYEHSAMKSGVSSNQINVVNYEPDRSLHHHMQGNQHQNNPPAYNPHVFA